MSSMSPMTTLSVTRAAMGPSETSIAAETVASVFLSVIPVSSSERARGYLFSTAQVWLAASFGSQSLVPRLWRGGTKRKLQFFSRRLRANQILGTQRSSTRGKRFDGKRHERAQRQRRTVKQRCRNQPEMGRREAGGDGREGEGEVRR